MAAERNDLVSALGHSLKAIDDDYKEEMRELRALFAEAKKEAEKDEPDGVKLKALLADANEMVTHLRHPRSGLAGRSARRQDVRNAVTKAASFLRRTAPCSGQHGPMFARNPRGPSDVSASHSMSTIETSWSMSE